MKSVSHVRRMKEAELGVRVLSFAPSRQVTRHRVLAALRSDGPLARIELSHRLGMSPATATETVTALLDEGVLCELRGNEKTPRGPKGQGRGRPRVQLGFNGARNAVIGVWIGQDEIELALADAAGNRLAERSIVTPLRSLSKADLLKRLAGMITKFGHEMAGDIKIAGIGIACQGYVDSELGRVAWSPVLTARDLPLASELSRRLKLPVVADNDASALALALARRDRTLQQGRVACLMIGDGVGLGLLLDGKLYRGARSGGSEFGHIRLDRRGPQCRCGGRGCIEASLADYAIARDALLVRGGRRRPRRSRAAFEKEMLAIAAEARAGNTALKALFDSAGRTLADGIGIIIQMLEPDHIIICGPGTRAEDLLRPAFEARLATAAIPELTALAKLSFVPHDARLRCEGVVLKALERLDVELAGSASANAA
jgi:predicted NBD/HSP70 family sugar kinase/DNA-binding transcriptional ArsR family regulator